MKKGSPESRRSDSAIPQFPRAGTVPARVDCSFADGSRRVLRYSRSRLANALELLTVAASAARLDAALRYGPDDAEAPDDGWGAWKERRGLDSSDPCVRALDAQLSWVLSAANGTVDGTPAAPILRYARGLGLGVASCVLPGRSNDVVRVSPSVRALQEALAFGVDLRFGKRVAGVGRDRVIGGEKFDAVVVAVEPGAVARVLADGAVDDPGVFDAFESETRTLSIHRDASAMPACRRDWRALNVTAGESAADASTLTVWLNAYYPEIDFAGDAFETWNPRKPLDHQIKSLALPRVVQSRAQSALHDRIAAMQGNHGLYFAGAHAVPGLGLLEQAASSGRDAGRRVGSDLLRPRRAEPPPPGRAAG